MKLAVVYDSESGNICDNFEDAKVLKIYDVEDREIFHTENIGTMAESTEDILSLITMMEADCVLCDNITPESIELLKEEGILLYSNLDGDADDIVFAFINGYLIFGPDD